MNKIICLLTGGHRYKDKNIITRPTLYKDYVILHNKCVKCGKVIEFDFCVGKYVREEIHKRILQKKCTREFDDNG